MDLESLPPLSPCLVHMPFYTCKLPGRKRTMPTLKNTNTLLTWSILLSKRGSCKGGISNILDWDTASSISVSYGERARMNLWVVVFTRAARKETAETPSPLFRQNHHTSIFSPTDFLCICVERESEAAVHLSEISGRFFLDMVCGMVTPIADQCWGEQQTSTAVQQSMTEQWPSV